MRSRYADNVARINKVMASEVARTYFNLQHFTKLDKNTYKAIASTNAEGMDEFHELVAKLSNNKLRVIEASIRDVDHNMVSMLLVANTISKPYNEESSKGMKVVSANVFTDGEQVWKLVGEGADKRLVLTSSDNLDELLNARRSLSMVSANFAALNTVVDYQNGDYVLYYSNVAGAVKSGHIVNIDGLPVVADLDTGKNVTLSSDYILVATTIADPAFQFNFEKGEVTAALSAQRGEEILKYFKTLYHDTPLYKAMEARISKMVADGRQVKPTEKRLEPTIF